MNKERLLKQLEIDEGIVPQVYLDSRGFKTFGIGHLVTRNDIEWNYPVGTTIKRSRIDECFKADVQEAIKNCKSLYKPHFDEWPAEVQEILVNMMFNLGFGGLSQFKRFKASLVSNNWKQAANEGRDSLWYKQVTNRAERLMSRLEKV
jgi:lysozyme